VSLIWNAVDGFFMAMARASTKLSGGNPDGNGGSYDVSRSTGHVVAEQWSFLNGSVRYNGHELFCFDRLGNHIVTVKKSRMTLIVGRGYLSPDEAASELYDRCLGSKRQLQLAIDGGV
jgi:hypothetical protein